MVNFRNQTFVTIGDKEWVLIKLLGKGAFGQVYLAVNQDDPSETAAIKMFDLSDRGLADFKEEAANASLIAKGWVNGTRGPVPYFLSVIGMNPEEPQWVQLDDEVEPFFIAYRVADGSLRSWRKKNSPTREQVDTAFTSLVQGMKEMHRLGYAHRDIKPDNILVYSDPNAPGGWSFTFGDLGSVCGPGSANEECDGSNRTTVTHVPYQSKPNRPLEGTDIGNHGYVTLADAQWTDMYGVACCLHFLIVGKDICSKLWKEWTAVCPDRRTSFEVCDRKPIVLESYPAEFADYQPIIQEMLNMPLEEFMEESEGAPE